MQTTLTACLLATAASAQVTIYDGTYGAIEGVGKATLNTVELAIDKLYTKKWKVGFSKETDWSGDAAEEVEVMLCDDNYNDSDAGDCYIYFVEDPSKKAKINVHVW